MQLCVRFSPEHSVGWTFKKPNSKIKKVKKLESFKLKGRTYLYPFSLKERKRESICAYGNWVFENFRFQILECVCFQTFKNNGYIKAPSLPTGWLSRNCLLAFAGPPLKPLKFENEQKYEEIPDFSLKLQQNKKLERLFREHFKEQIVIGKDSICLALTRSVLTKCFWVPPSMRSLSLFLSLIEDHRWLF